MAAEELAGSENEPAGPTTTTAAAAPTETPEKAPVSAAKGAAPEAEVAKPEPEPDPESCRGLALSQAAFEEAVHAGEFAGSDYLFYLEQAGVLNANLICARSYPAESVRAGILMTKRARDTKTVFFDDGLNPERYELGFPKEFGYVKSIQHYVPESREHAKYPWSKKY